MAKHTVIFTPSGLRTEAEEGQTVYDVALAAGVDIQSICGGKGLCKRCQCEIDTGKHAKFKLDVKAEHVGKLTPTEKKAIFDEELSDTRRLACRAKILGDLVVDIPSDAREAESSIQKKATPIDVPLNPVIKLYMVQLAVPELDDNPCDGDALISKLKDEHGIEAGYTHEALIKLQDILRAHERTVICVVRSEKQIVDIWPPTEGNTYGAAIDVGSTSVALYMFNLSTGKIAYEKAAMNPQIRYGEDLMSRVSYIMMNKGGEVKLTEAIRRQIKTMLAEAVESLNIKTQQLLDVICVGNPIMHHLLIGANPVELGQAPFPLVVKDWLDIPAHKMDFGLSDAAQVSLFPLIGGHVGADTTAAYLTQIDTMKDRSVLLVDIGTNAEIVLSHNGKVAAASSPTGPALEGAEISCGVRASLGAIERVRIDPVTKKSKFKIIGHDDWLSDEDDLSDFKISGICGSGIFEVMVELANAGLIDPGGLFVSDDTSGRMVPDNEGKSQKYVLVNRAENPLFIKQTDIRAVQLAKAALFAGAELIAENLGCAEFDEILLAGAFGTHLDPKYVSEIGIVPRAPANIIRSIGNAAGMGAAMALLDKTQRTKIIEATKQIVKVETAMEPKFQDYFVASMKFPTATGQSQDNKQRRRRRRKS